MLRQARILWLTAFLFPAAVLACDGGERAALASGAVEVTATTSGEQPDPDGYTVALDGDAAVDIGPTGTVTLSDLAPGEHQLTLEGVATNCAVQGPVSRTVTVVEADTAALTFTIACTRVDAPFDAAIRVHTTTTGSSVDADGYTVAVSAKSGQLIPANGVVTITGLESGESAVALDDVAYNCAVEGEYPRRVTLEAGPPVAVEFTIVCRTTAPLNWTRMSSGTTDDITMLSGTSSENVFAATDWQDCDACGGVMRILRFDGSEWTEQLSGTGQFLELWAAPDGQAYAARTTRSPTPILRYDRTAWAPMPAEEIVSADATIYGLWGSSAHDVFAVGGIYNESGSGPGYIAHYDGTVWQPMTVPAGTGILFAAWGTSPTDVYAVGVDRDQNGVVLHFDGQQWSRVAVEPNIALFSIWGSGPLDVYVTGATSLQYGDSTDYHFALHGAIRHFDGITWSAIQSPTSAPLGGGWAFAPSDVYIIDDRGQLWRFDGNDWTGLDSGVPFLSGIWGSPTGDVFVGGYGGLLLRKP